MADIFKLTPEQRAKAPGLIKLLEASQNLTATQQGFLAQLKASTAPPPSWMDQLQSQGGDAINQIGSNLVGGAQNLLGMGGDVVKGIVGNDEDTQAAGQDFLTRSGLPQNLDQLSQAFEAGKAAIASGAKGQLNAGALRAVPSHLLGAVPLVGPMLQQAGTEASQGEYGKAAGDVLTLKGVPEAGGAAAGFLTKGIEGLGKGLYESAIPYGQTVTPLDIAAMRREGWQNQIPMTEGGAQRAQEIADSSLANVDAEIDKDPTRPILTRDATMSLQQLADQYRESNFPEKAAPLLDKLAEIRKRWGFAQPGVIANKFKRNDNALLHDSQFADNAAPTEDKQIIKTLLSGERDAISDAYPAIRKDNLRAHTMIELKNAAEAATKRPLLSGGAAGTALSMAALATLHSVYPHLTPLGVTLMSLREGAKNPGIASRAGLSVQGLSSGAVRSGLNALPYVGYGNTDPQEMTSQGDMTPSNGLQNVKDYMLQPGYLLKALRNQQ